MNSTDEGAGKVATGDRVVNDIEIKLVTDSSEPP